MVAVAGSRARSPALRAPARAERPKRGSRARPSGRTIPPAAEGERRGPGRPPAPPPTSPAARNLRGHGPHEARSTHPEPGAAAATRGGPRGRGQTRPPPGAVRVGRSRERRERGGPSRQHARPLGLRRRAARGAGLAAAAEAMAEAMAARGGLGPRRDSRRRRPPDGTEVTPQCPRATEVGSRALGPSRGAGAGRRAGRRAPRLAGVLGLAGGRLAVAPAAHSCRGRPCPPPHTHTQPPAAARRDVRVLTSPCRRRPTCPLPDVTRRRRGAGCCHLLSGQRSRASASAPAHSCDAPCVLAASTFLR
uniref:spidroin-2-like n=1 Tax=Nyctereutes procyonoides TaxID=34880 RepID=UPI002444EAFF|nr:spidroin-2-like [Nyctereutes procyonoides]